MSEAPLAGARIGLPTASASRLGGGVFEAGAALRCETGPADIARALEAGFALEEPGWLGMARAAQGLAAGPFAPATIAHRWGEAYAALLAREAPR